MNRRKYLKQLSEALDMSYKTLINADMKCFIDEFLSDVMLGRIDVMDEKKGHFKYRFKKPIYRMKINDYTGRLMEDSEEKYELIEFLFFDSKNSHIIFNNTKIDEDNLNLRSLLMKEYGLKWRESEEALRLPIKRFLKSFKHPDVKLGTKKIKFIN